MHEIKISLTDYFFRIQDAIGFSITDIYEKEQRKAVVKSWNHPFFREPDPKTACDVFVIMPFDEHFKPVYEDHIKKVCDAIGLDCKRGDLVLSTKSIVDDIWSLINNAQIIICDCTGKNPNVFYELGIAHALGKKTICITQSKDDIPFDIEHLRYIEYTFTQCGMSKFESTLKQHIAAANARKYY